MQSVHNDQRRAVDTAKMKAIVTLPVKKLNAGKSEMKWRGNLSIFIRTNECSGLDGAGRGALFCDISPAGMHGKHPLEVMPCSRKPSLPCTLPFLSS